MTQSPSNEPAAARPRPLGVWILTGLAFLLGLYPVLQLLIPFQAGEDSFFSLLDSFGQFAVAGGLGLILAAIGAWLGNNLGRLLMIALIIFFAFALAAVAVDASFERDTTGQLLLLAPPVLLAVLYLWYFNRPAVKAYYQASQ